MKLVAGLASSLPARSSQFLFRCRNTTLAAGAGDHLKSAVLGGVGHCARLRRPSRPTPPKTNSEFPPLARTLPQAIHGRVFQTIDEVRNAVRNFAARYNAAWLIEKNGYLSPLDARGRR